MALELRLPIVRLVDGTGGGGSVKSLDTDRRTYVPPLLGWQHAVDNLATVPVVALALGLGGRPGRGPGGQQPLRPDGPRHRRRCSWPARRWWPGWRRAVTKEELGGDHIHGRNGVVDDVVDSEDEAFARTRRFLSYLPSSVHELARRAATRPTTPSAATSGCSAPSPATRGRSTRSGPIIESLVDAGSWLEIGAGWGRAAVCGLARLDGWPVAVLAVGPLPGRGQLDGRRQRQDHPLRRPGRHLPPAGRAPRRPARASWSAWRASGPPPSATACGPWPPSTRPRCRGARC